MDQIREVIEAPYRIIYPIKPDQTTYLPSCIQPKMCCGKKDKVSVGNALNSSIRKPYRSRVKCS